MKRIVILVALITFQAVINAQVTRIAILDFENISGIAKYDGLGKAMSSMLISDIESNVSPKRLQLVERAQIQNILKEQNFQASGSVNKTTAVQAGKILGVKYLLIGDVFVLNDQLFLNARLANTETGDIVFSKKQEGKMTSWLSLKTNIAKDLANSLSMPFTLPRINDFSIATSVLTTYANAIVELDKGNFEKAETFISKAKEFNPGFGYFDDLKDDVDKLKRQVVEQGKKIDILEKSGGRIVNAKTFEELNVNLKNELSSYEEKKKIFIQIINLYPEKWRLDSGPFYELFLSKADLFNNGLKGCTLLLNDILETRKFINKNCLKYYDRIVYGFIGYSLNYALINSNDIFEHSFSDNDYIEFKKVSDFVIKNAFIDSSYQLFAQFNILSFFYLDETKYFNHLVKSDILNNHQNIYTLLNYSYGTQIIKLCKDVKIDITNKIINPFQPSLVLIIFLSSSRLDFKDITIGFYNQKQEYKIANSYLSKDKSFDQYDLISYKEKLNRISEYFSIPTLFK